MAKDGKAEREAVLEAQRTLEQKHGSAVYEPATQDELVAFRQEIFVGPLPHPELLAGYERACPGSAERIVGMAEKQAGHRRSLEIKALEASIRKDWTGQIMAFSLSMTVCGGGIYLLAHGEGLGGLTALLTPLIGLAGMFLASKRESRSSSQSSKKESDKENQALPPAK